MLKLTTDKHEASRGLSATAQLLVIFLCDESKNVKLRSGTGQSARRTDCFFTCSAGRSGARQWIYTYGPNDRRPVQAGRPERS